MKLAVVKPWCKCIFYVVAQQPDENLLSLPDSIIF